jgi:hypothetical protein
MLVPQIGLGGLGFNGVILDGLILNYVVAYQNLHRSGKVTGNIVLLAPELM